MPEIVIVRTPYSSGGSAVSGRIDAPAPAATRSAISRIPSTSTVTGSSSPCASGCGVDLVTQRVLVRREHEPEREQRRRAAPAASRQLRVGRDHREQRLLEQRLGPQVADG